MCSADEIHTLDRFVHEAMLYDSDEEFLGVAVPFLKDGAAAGDTTFLGVRPRLRDLVLDALGDDSGLEVVDGQYTAPLSTLRLNHKLFSRHFDAGATRIRMVGEIPPTATGPDWHGWARYEAAINHFYAAFPLWGICPYDTRTTPDDVLDDVVLTHARLASPGSHQVNPRYSDPAAFIARRARSEIDPLESTGPQVELDDPLPADARRAVVALAGDSGLGDAAIDGLGLATSEVTANAQAHGSPPVRLSAWAREGRVVVAVSDCGVGPDDPYAGLMMPATGDHSAGLGLHIAHQLCQTTLTYSASEFTVHLVARDVE